MQHPDMNYLVHIFFQHAERTQQDLEVLSTYLRHSMSSVKEMVINMRGVEQNDC